MTLSSAWRRGLGFFGTASLVGAGVGLTAFLAKKSAQYCNDNMTDTVDSFLDGEISLNGYEATVSFAAFPTPIQLTLNNLSFALRDTLATALINNLQQFPSFFANFCEDVVWEQSAVILLTFATISGLSICFYDGLKNRATMNRSDMDDVLLHDVDQSINNGPRR
jgi:hypothetical protein